ncbi:MAG TPA: hypothetical protein VGM51_16020 [Armatimonadota bacterium]|jgi:hypothetical protein
MNSWDDIDRHMGPAGPAPDAGTETAQPPGFDVPTPLQAEGAPSSSRTYEPLRAPEQEVLPALTPKAESESDEWTAEDEFNPRYCTVCHRKIPFIVSERQEMCNTCFATRNVAVQPLPVSGVPFMDTAPIVHCPMCAGTNVERQWKNDWVSTAVDIVSDAAALGTMLFGTIGMYRTNRVDWNRDVGRVKVMRHRCLDCGHTWVE